MKIDGSVALVTGTSRGIGRQFATQLVERGAKVYATARDPRQIDVPGAEKLALDITEPTSVTTAAEAAGDVNLLVNNAGLSLYQNLVTGDLAKIHDEFNTHLWGTLGMIRTFAPILGRNGGGAILNVLSAMSWFSYDGANSCSVGQGRGVGADQRRPSGTHRAGHARDRPAHGRGRYRHDGLASTSTSWIPPTLRRPPWTESSKAASSSWPTTGHSMSRPRSSTRQASTRRWPGDPPAVGAGDR